MFFQFKVPPEPGVSQEAPNIPEPEINSDGEPLYMMSPNGRLIINDPALVKVVSTGDGLPPQEDLELTTKYAGHGLWVSVSSDPFYAAKPAAQ